MTTIRRSFLAAVCAALLLAGTSALAEDYPVKPIRLVVPSPPGGALDAYARVVSPELQKELGQPVVVDNVPGADGIIGTLQVAKAKPDGYTVLDGAIQMFAMNAAVRPQLPYDMLKDFAPVTQTVAVNYVLVVNAKLPIKTVPELIAYAKANPGKITYGTSGSGSPQHLGVALFQARTGVDLLHVPFKGIGQVVPSLVGGHVDMAIADQASMMPHVKAGALRALAVGGLRRSAEYPELPTIAEAANLPGFEVVAWQGIAVPQGTPPDVVQRLNDAFRKVHAMPAVHERLTKMGFDLVGSSPDAFRRYIGDETAKWTKVAKDYNIKAE